MAYEMVNGQVDFYTLPILPIFVDARNSSLFYSRSMVYKPLAGMLLAHEIFNENAQTIKVGQSIPFQKIKVLPLTKKETAKLIRHHLYRVGKGKSPLFETEQTIVHPPDRRAIKKELQQAELLGETTDGKKYICLIINLIQL